MILLGPLAVTVLLRSTRCSGRNIRTGSRCRTKRDRADLGAASRVLDRDLRIVESLLIERLLQLANLGPQTASNGRIFRHDGCSDRLASHRHPQASLDSFSVGELDRYAISEIGTHDRLFRSHGLLRLYGPEARRRLLRTHSSFSGGT
jgi:hypothetical protein